MLAAKRKNKETPVKYSHEVLVKRKLFARKKNIPKL